MPSYEQKRPFEDMPSTDGMSPVEAYKALKASMTISWVKDVISAQFGSQKAFADFMGVGPSSVTNWIKSGALPDQAKRLLSYWIVALRNRQALAIEKQKLKSDMEDLKQSWVVKSHDGFSIVSGAGAEEPSYRTVTARGIASYDEALRMASGQDAWQLIELLNMLLLSGQLEQQIEDTCEELGLEQARVRAISFAIRRQLDIPLYQYQVFKKRWADPNSFLSEASMFADDANPLLNLRKRLREPVESAEGDELDPHREALLAEMEAAEEDRTWEQALEAEEEEREREQARQDEIAEFLEIEEAHVRGEERMQRALEEEVEERDREYKKQREIEEDLEFEAARDRFEGLTPINSTDEVGVPAPGQESWLKKLRDRQQDPKHLKAGTASIGETANDVHKYDGE